MENHQTTESAGGQVRMMLWGTPRSVSTVFAKFMSFIDDSQIYFEPYLCARWFGPDSTMFPENLAMAREFVEAASVVTSVTEGFERSECSFSWVKKQLEKPHAGKKLIFCKEMCFAPEGNYASLPVGYHHVFLLRHPLKVFPSWKKIYPFGEGKDFKLDEAPPVFFPTGFAFKEMSELLDHVKTALDPEPIIVDTDDLLSNPQGILSELFKKLGLPFQDKYLQWEDGGEISKKWIICKTFLQGQVVWDYYKNAFGSTCFTKPSPLPERSSLTADILRCVDASMPYYDKMFAQRLTPQK